MNNNTRQMASSDLELPFPRDGQFEPTSSSPVADLRSVSSIRCFRPQAFRRSFSPREGLDNNMGRGNQQQHRPPLGLRSGADWQPSARDGYDPRLGHPEGRILLQRTVSDLKYSRLGDRHSLCPGVGFFLFYLRCALRGWNCYECSDCSGSV